MDDEPIEGGYTQIAAWLNERYGRQISRQNVYAWWRRRARNGFPGGRMLPTPNGGDTRRFLWKAVHAWYRDQYGVE